MKNKRYQPLTGHGERDAEGDLFAAFILCGWEKTGKSIEDAMDAATLLAAADPNRARQLSGYLVRGKEVPKDIARWAKDIKRRHDYGEQA